MSIPNDLGPVPSPQHWQEQVRAALRETDEAKPRLRWTQRDAIRWDLNGNCPRCGDYTSAVVAGVVAADTAFETGTLVELVMECACEPGHGAGRPGCGAGRGTYITVRAPEGSEA